MAVNLTFSLEDLPTLYHAGFQAKAIPTEEFSGRFNYFERGRSGMPEMELASPAFAEASVLWFDSVASALLAKKILESEGHEAHIMLDSAAQEIHELYSILTSWDCTEFNEPLTEDPVVAEFMINGDAGGDLTVFTEEVIAFTEQFSSTELMGEPTMEDHGDHFHLLGLVKLPGLQLPGFIEDLSDNFSMHVGVQIVSRDV